MQQLPPSSNKPSNAAATSNIESNDGVHAVGLFRKLGAITPAPAPAPTPAPTPAPAPADVANPSIKRIPSMPSFEHPLNAAVAVDRHHQPHQQQQQQQGKVNRSQSLDYAPPTPLAHSSSLTLSSVSASLSVLSSSTSSASKVIHQRPSAEKASSVAQGGAAASKTKQDPIKSHQQQQQQTQNHHQQQQQQRQKQQQPSRRDYKTLGSPRKAVNFEQKANGTTRVGAGAGAGAMDNTREAQLVFTNSLGVVYRSLTWQQQSELKQYARVIEKAFKSIKKQYISLRSDSDKLKQRFEVDKVKLSKSMQLRKLTALEVYVHLRLQLFAKDMDLHRCRLVLLKEKLAVVKALLDDPEVLISPPQKSTQPAKDNVSAIASGDAAVGAVGAGAADIAGADAISRRSASYQSNFQSLTITEASFSHSQLALSPPENKNDLHRGSIGLFEETSMSLPTTLASSKKLTADEKLPTSADKPQQAQTQAHAQVQTQTQTQAHAQVQTQTQAQAQALTQTEVQTPEKKPRVHLLQDPNIFDSDGRILLSFLCSAFDIYGTNPEIIRMNFDRMSLDRRARQAHNEYAITCKQMEKEESIDRKTRVLKVVQDLHSFNLKNPKQSYLPARDLEFDFTVLLFDQRYQEGIVLDRWFKLVESKDPKKIPADFLLDWMDQFFVGFSKEFKVPEKFLDTCRLLIQRVLFPRIWEICISGDQDETTKIDAHFQSQAKWLRKLPPEEIGLLPPQIPQNPDEIPYHGASLVLSEIVQLVVPADMLNCLYASAQLIFDYLTVYDAQYKEAVRGTKKESLKVGADGFFPVFLFVVIHAEIPFIHRIMGVMKSFSTQTEKMSEAGYYLTCLESALIFIGNEKKSQHMKSPEKKSPMNGAETSSKLASKSVNASPPPSVAIVTNNQKSTAAAATTTPDPEKRTPEPASTAQKAAGSS